MTKAHAKTLDELVVRPARADAGGDDGAHAGAADQVDRHARGAQRLDDADMGEGARAAARHDDAHGVAGQQPRQPVDVGMDVEADMVVLAVEAARQHGRGRAGRRIVAFMQQHQLAAAMEHRAGLRRFDLERHHGRPVVVAAAHHDQAVGLAQAELGPFRRRRVGAVEHERRFHLAAREPFRILVERIRDRASGPGCRCGRARRPAARRNAPTARRARSAGWRRCAAGGDAWSAPWRCARRRCASAPAAPRDEATSACRSCCGPAATLRCRAGPRRCACAGCATAATSRRRCCRAGSRPSGSARSALSSSSWRNTPRQPLATT